MTDVTSELITLPGQFKAAFNWDGRRLDDLQKKNVKIMVAKRFELLHLTIPEDSTVNSVKM